MAMAKADFDLFTILNMAMAKADFDLFTILAEKVIPAGFLVAKAKPNKAEPMNIKIMFLVAIKKNPMAASKQANVRVFVLNILTILFNMSPAIKPIRVYIAVTIPLVSDLYPKFSSNRAIFVLNTFMLMKNNIDMKASR